MRGEGPRGAWPPAMLFIRFGWFTTNKSKTKKKRGTNGFDSGAGRRRDGKPLQIFFFFFFKNFFFGVCESQLITLIRRVKKKKGGWLFFFSQKRRRKKEGRTKKKRAQNGAHTPKEKKEGVEKRAISATHATLH